MLQTPKRLRSVSLFKLKIRSLLWVHINESGVLLRAEFWDDAEVLRYARIHSDTHLPHFRSCRYKERESKIISGLIYVSRVP